MILHIFLGDFTLEYSSRTHLMKKRPRRALARVVSARLSGKGGGEIIAEKPLFFLYEKGTREFLDKEDESTDNMFSFLFQASAFARGESIKAFKPSSSSRRHQKQAASFVVHAAASGEAERLRLHNLSPLPGSRRKPIRKGRGYGAGQGGTCGFGMRGQKARGGRGTRPGFEGGQTPMYRRFPKLKGIAGGMSAGKPKFVTVNVSDLAQALADSKISAGQDVDLDTLKSVGLIKATGYYRNLPLKVLGDGELSQGLKVKAAAFSASASEKLAGAGGEAILVQGKKPKWSREAHEAAQAAAAK